MNQTMKWACSLQKKLCITDVFIKQLFFIFLSHLYDENCPDSHYRDRKEFQYFHFKDMVPWKG